jgi:hypothetical protein
MQNLQELREITVAQIEAFADAPDDEMAQTLVLDSIDEEIRAVRREYEPLIRAAEKLLEEADETTPRGATKERLRIALAGVSTG